MVIIHPEVKRKFKLSLMKSQFSTEYVFKVQAERLIKLSKKYFLFQTSKVQIREHRGLHSINL